MLQLSGAPALSEFRQERLLQRLQDVEPGVQAVYAEYVHFIDLQGRLTDPEQSVLERLLTYGPRRHRQESPAGRLRLVVPRPGTISPWSSKATDIIRNCGLTQINRVERGIAYWLDGNTADTGSRALDPVLHDRMTEAVLDDAAEAETLFGTSEPAPLTRIDLQARGRLALEEADRAMGLALADDEIEYLVDSYRDMGRDPTDVELMMFAQANSEHCRHKIFNADWSVNGSPQSHSLFQMIRYTHECSPEGVLSAYRDNSAVVEGFRTGRFYPQPDTNRYGFSDEPVHILMKVETHNHPTAISPFSGAATGAGGEIRDEGATGLGAKPKAGMTGFTVSNLLLPGFRHPWETEYGRPARMSSALDIMLDAPLGGAAFNNEFGRPNLTGYFRTFELSAPGVDGTCVWGYHKPIMLAGGYGNIREDHVHKHWDDVPQGTRLVVLGGPAMQIGLGGGAASSVASGASEADLDFASVQRGNPEMERRCQEVIDRCWAMGSDNPLLFIHDVGAGGLSNALPELINDGGGGGRIALRDIPNAEPGMSPLAIWSNESQERYVLAVAPHRLADFERLCARERCPFAVVGETTDDRHLVVEDALLGNTPVDMPLGVLLGKPPRMQRAFDRNERPQQKFSPDDTLRAMADRVLRLPAVAGKNFLITIGDRSITGLVARDQMVGPWQIPVADSAVTTTGYRGYTGEAMAVGERTPVAVIDPPASGRLAIAEAITNLAGTPIARLSDIRISANWMAAVGHPGEDQALFDTVKAVGLELCPQLGVAIPVGKDSMSMKTGWQEASNERSVVSPVSLVATAFAPVPDVRRTVTPQLRTDRGDTTLLLIDLGRGRNRLGGSALAQVYGRVGHTPADLDYAEDLKTFFAAMQALLGRDRVLAYHDRSDGGLFVSLAEMAFAAHTGLDIRLDAVMEKARYSSTGVPGALFSEELGAVLQVRSEDLDEVMKELTRHGVGDMVQVLGEPALDDRLTFRLAGETVLTLGRADAVRTWWETSFRIQALRDNAHCARQEFDRWLDVDDPGLHADLRFTPRAPETEASGDRPRVAILREQGVNGQTEMAAAFTEAGFDAQDVHMTDVLDGRDDLSTYAGLVACGGFSYGDVLGAGGGWARTILFNDRARLAFKAFFERSETFALGICNGCQMLANLRELIPGTEHWPQFVRNTSEQFEARTVMVQIEDSPSVLLRGMAGSRLPVPVAHGEGRTDFSPAQAPAEGRVVLRYVDNRGDVTTDYPFNPNGSDAGVTGLCSADGRVTIMMPHPERVFRTVTNSWYPDDWPEDGPWMQLFYNARAWVAEQTRTEAEAQE